jgi:hypothetical protein
MTTEIFGDTKMEREKQKAITRLGVTADCKMRLVAPQLY